MLVVLRAIRLHYIVCLSYTLLRLFELIIHDDVPITAKILCTDIDYHRMPSHLAWASCLILSMYCKLIKVVIT